METVYKVDIKFPELAEESFIIFDLSEIGDLVIAARKQYDVSFYYHENISINVSQITLFSDISKGGSNDGKGKKDAS